MNRCYIVVALALAMVGCAIEPRPAGPPNGRYLLDNGGALIVDDDGRMRTFNAGGHPVFVPEGTRLTLVDGTVVTMHENVIWRELRTRHTLNPK